MMATNRGSFPPARAPRNVGESAEDVAPEILVGLAPAEPTDLDRVLQGVDHPSPVPQLQPPRPDRPPWFGTGRGPTATQLAEWARQHVREAAPS